MKTLIQTLTIGSLAFLVACTSNEKAMKKAAEAAAAAQFKSTIAEESKGYLTQSDSFKTAYISFMVKYSEFSADETKMNGESFGVATVYIKSYTPDARKKLLQVASSVSPDAVNRFNFANAMQLISKQTGIPGEPMKYPFAVLNLRKDATGEWIVQK
ncbi:hypothetical protein ACLVWU_13865 [Bdellovibrio sp. HCB290]|uniref:hypothetical protein n=1 Tax=Bdellovibrio sp. HCB290 TaxID=3394356 RepID=UPI0039B46902